jgi:hypothetical protein
VDCAQVRPRENTTAPSNISLRAGEPTGKHERASGTKPHEPRELGAAALRPKKAVAVVWRFWDP